MSFFDDEDDDDQATGALAVARALNPSDEEEPEEEGADSRSGDKKTAEKKDKSEDTAQEIAASSPYQGVSEPPEEEISSDAPANDDEAIGAMAGQQPMKAPVVPTLKPFSSAPLDAAQELATAKGDFGKRISRGDFKPGIGRKIGAALAGGAVSFGTGDPRKGLDVVDRVEGAPLSRARAGEDQNEASIQSRIDAGNLENQRITQENANQTQQFKLGETDMRNKGYVNHQNALAEQENANADAKRNAVTSWTPKDPNNPAAGGTGRTADGQTVENVPPPDAWMKNWAKSPEGVASSLRMTVNARQGLADSIFGKGSSQEKQEYIATGKISRAPSVKIPSAQLQQYEDWKKAFKTEHGRDPNASEIQSQGHHMSGAVSKNLIDRINSQKNTKIQSAEKEFSEGLIDKDEYLNRWQSAQDDFEQRLTDASGEDVHHVTIKDNVDPNTLQWHGEAPPQPKPMQQPAQPAQQASATPAAQPAAAGAKTFQYKGSTFTVNQKITVDGKPAVITGYNPQTGKPKVQVIQGQ